MLQRRLIATALAALLLLPLIGAGAVAWHLHEHDHHGAGARHDAGTAAALLHGHEHPDGHPPHAHDLVTVTAPCRERGLGAAASPALPAEAATPLVGSAVADRAEAPPPPGPSLHLLHCVQLT